MKHSLSLKFNFGGNQKKYERSSDTKISIFVWQSRCDFLKSSQALLITMYDNNLTEHVSKSLIIYFLFLSSCGNLNYDGCIKTDTRKTFCATPCLQF